MFQRPAVWFVLAGLDVVWEAQAQDYNESSQIQLIWGRFTEVEMGKSLYGALRREGRCADKFGGRISCVQLLHGAGLVPR